MTENKENVWKLKAKRKRPQNSPVLPALNEINIQRVVLLFRIFSRLASRLSLGIEPSSIGRNSLVFATPGWHTGTNGVSGKIQSKYTYIEHA